MTNLLNESESNVERLSEQTKILKDELRRSERPEQREGLNVQYLKNVVLKFLQYREEREQLIPVLAMLLSFSPEELRTVRGAHSRETAAAAPATADSRWGSLFPRFS